VFSVEITHHYTRLTLVMVHFSLGRSLKIKTIWPDMH
jgi:hypothetical protein